MDDERIANHPYAIIASSFLQAQSGCKVVRVFPAKLRCVQPRPQIWSCSRPSSSRSLQGFRLTLLRIVL